jgi:hypothetical protein
MAMLFATDPEKTERAVKAYGASSDDIRTGLADPKLTSHFLITMFDACDENPPA